MLCVTDTPVSLLLLYVIHTSLNTETLTIITITTPNQSSKLQYVRSAAVQNSSITGCQLAQLSSFTSNSMTSPGSLRYVHEPQSITNRNVNMSFLTDQYIYMHVIIMTAIFLSESSAAVYMVIITLHMVTTAAKNTFRNLFQSP